MKYSELSIGQIVDWRLGPSPVLKGLFRGKIFHVCSDRIYGVGLLITKGGKNAWPSLGANFANFRDLQDNGLSISEEVRENPKNYLSKTQLLQYSLTQICPDDVMKIILDQEELY